MAFKDPQRRRLYHREYARLRRTRVCQTPCQTPLPSEFRLKTARDIQQLIAEQIQAVRAETNASTLEKARTIGFLANVALRAVEAADLNDRVEALELTLKHRKREQPCDPSTANMTS